MQVPADRFQHPDYPAPPRGLHGETTLRRGMPRVAVVGAGITGASVAWHLARAGAAVTVLERSANASSGATGGSYGWVGTGSMLPSDALPRFALIRDALPEFARLSRQLGPLPIAARGAVVWSGTDADTDAFVAEQQGAGIGIDRLDRARTMALEPHLNAPALAAWLPGDFALEPDLLTAQLLSAARASGARVGFNQEVLAIETRHGRVTAVATPHGSHAVDAVVLANAASAIPLAARFDIDLPVHEAPAVLMAFDALPGCLHHLLCAADHELRPRLGGGLLLAADMPIEGETGLDSLARQCLADTQALFKIPAGLALRSARAVQRPMTADSMPVRGFLPGVDGLYAAIAHPGVMLAPWLGRLAAQDIMAA